MKLEEEKLAGSVAEELVNELFWEDMKLVEGMLLMGVVKLVDKPQP